MSMSTVNEHKNKTFIDNTYYTYSRTYDRAFIHQSWNTFQSLRQHNRANPTSGQVNKRNVSNQNTSSNGKNKN